MEKITHLAILMVTEEISYVTNLETFSIAQSQEVVMSCLRMVRLFETLQLLVIHRPECWCIRVFTDAFCEHVQVGVVLVPVEIPVVLWKQKSKSIKWICI